MKIKIYKFGGTFFTNQKNYTKLYRLALKNKNKNKLIFIVSAIGRENDPYSTSTLLNYSSRLEEKEKNIMLSIGEIFSSLKLTNYLIGKGINVKCLLLNEVKIITNSLQIKGEVKNYLNDYDVLIIPGFIGMDVKGNISNLDRGGSDLSSLIYANKLGINEVYLNKETSGILSTNLDYISNKEILKKLSYEQAIRYLTYSGEAVQIKALEYAKEHNIILNINSLDSKSKTVISEEENDWCIYGITTLFDKIYIFGKTDEYTLMVIKDFLRNFKNIKYVVHVGFIELFVEKNYIDIIVKELHKRFIE